ncbi:MAG: ABC-2 transporter permease, partial [Lachnospiraceae bacterium]|nr:ABC-2 transporter permease [Lachnospiraceae bacterium]
MSALLLKDFYMIRKYCRLQLILTVVFIAGYALGGPGNMSIFMLAYPIIMAAMIPYTLLAYEERDKWDVYARSLPLSVRDLVAEKYILGLIMITAVSVIVVILSFITGFLPANAPAGSGRHLYQTVKLLPILIA